MSNNDTWESSAYRCQICMQLFSDEVNQNMTPLIVCPNIHTVCRKCASSIRETSTSKCPQCRTDLWKHDVVNRDLVYFMSKLHLKCGGCSSNIQMSCSTAFKHSQECLENHVPCPLLNNDLTLSRCNQNMSISSLWQHCIEYHSENSQNLIMLDSHENIGNGERTATLLVSVTLEMNSYTYFKIRTKYNSYNMCMHITTMYNAQSESNDMLFCFRRFFPEVSLSFKRIMMSVEIGEIYGMLLPVPSVVSVYENMQSLKEMAIDERICKLVQIPRKLFKQISLGSEFKNEVLKPCDHDNPTMSISVQFFFNEVSNEQEDDAVAEVPESKRAKVL